MNWRKTVGRRAAPWSDQDYGSVTSRLALASRAPREDHRAAPESRSGWKGGGDGPLHVQLRLHAGGMGEAHREPGEPRGAGRPDARGRRLQARVSLVRVR